MIDLYCEEIRYSDLKLSYQGNDRKFAFGFGGFGKPTKAKLYGNFSIMRKLNAFQKQYLGQSSSASRSQVIIECRGVYVFGSEIRPLEVKDSVRNVRTQSLR